MYWWYLIRENTETMIMTEISKAKKRPAILVEMEIPRIIMSAAKTRKTTVQTNHGTFFNPAML